MSLLWAEENICIALAYFLTNSHPSVCAPFVLLQTFGAWAQHSRCPYRQVELLPSQCSQLTAALVSFVWMSKELKQSLEMWVRGEERAAVQPAWYSTCTITPFTGDRNLSPMPQQCQWQPKPDCVVSSGNWSLFTDRPVCPTLWFSSALMFFLAEKEYTHLNPLTQTDMFPQLQPYDTRPGSWLCCPVQKRNLRERSADMVSSDGEYSAGDIER